MQENLVWSETVKFLREKGYDLSEYMRQAAPSAEKQERSARLVKTTAERMEAIKADPAKRNRSRDALKFSNCGVPFARIRRALEVADGDLASGELPDADRTPAGTDFSYTQIRWVVKKHKHELLANEELAVACAD